MKAPSEPNLRAGDPRLPAVMRRAAVFAGPWRAADCRVLGGEGPVCTAADPATARHIADAHNHLLPLYNALTFRGRSHADLEKQ